MLDWYEKALRGRYAEIIGDDVLTRIGEELVVEFPATNTFEKELFYKKRAYEVLADSIWK